VGLAITIIMARSLCKALRLLCVRIAIAKLYWLVKWLNVLLQSSGMRKQQGFRIYNEKSNTWNTNCIERGRPYTHSLKSIDYKRTK